MNKSHWAAAAALSFASTCSWSAPPAGPAPAASHDEAMLALASHSGCLTCHSIKPAAGDQGTKPVGPAWQDVSAKYKDQKDAVQSLTTTVMGGTNPYASHWKGKVSGLAMPPNAVAISRKDAEQLVQWILSLDGRST